LNLLGDNIDTIEQGWANSGPPRQSEKFNLLCYPITADIEELQLELIDM
jgi:hypothetical protein